MEPKKVELKKTEEEKKPPSVESKKKAESKKEDSERRKKREIPLKLRPPLIVSPNEASLGTLVFLHGFGLSGEGMAEKWSKKLQVSRFRLVFLNAPKRRISCYPEHPVEPAWHDYLTDHGGLEGKPEIEEVINEKHLVEIRKQIHQSFRSEADTFYDGDTSKIALVGESQGACVALDAALTFDGKIAGVFSSFGMLYSGTPIADDSQQNVVAFHGANDDVIAASLAMQSYSRLLRRHRFSLTIEPDLTHCQPSDTEVNALSEALTKWFPSEREKATKKDNNKKNIDKENSPLPTITTTNKKNRKVYACTQCATEKPADLFSKKQLTKAPLLRKCKACVQVLVDQQTTSSSSNNKNHH